MFVVLLMMAPPSQELEPPANPARFIREWFGIARDMSVGAYVDACARRIFMRHVVDDALRTVDAIIAPTLCVALPPRWADKVTIAGAEYDFTMGLVRLSCLFNHTGHPALAVPATGASDKIASSLQIVGQHGEEGTILRYATFLEEPSERPQAPQFAIADGGA